MVLNQLDMISNNINISNSKLLEGTIDIDSIGTLDEEVDSLLSRAEGLAENVRLYDTGDGNVYVEFSELHRYMKATNTEDIQTALIEVAESNGADPDSVTIIFPSLEATGYVTKDSKEKIEWSSEQIQNTINKGIPCVKCNESFLNEGFISNVAKKIRNHNIKKSAKYFVKNADKNIAELEKWYGDIDNASPKKLDQYISDCEVTVDFMNMADMKNELKNYSAEDRAKYNKQIDLCKKCLAKAKKVLK